MVKRRGTLTSRLSSKKAGCGWPAVGLGLWVCLWLGDLFFGPEGRIASHAQGDAVRSFVYLRQFGFEQWASGDFPLWNPHLFSGTPFVGSFQSSMLYPPTWVHWGLPLAVGINFELAMSLYLLMLGTFLWARGQSLSVSASFLCATIAGLGGTVSLRVLAGALTVLASYAWFPWLMLGLDRLARQRSLGAWLLVTGAAAMLLLAGHPPTAFMIFLVLGVYHLPRWVRDPHRWGELGTLLLAAVVAGSMAGLQLALGYDTAAESIRRSGVALDFATAWSFPPENWITLWAPTFYGDASATRVDYFGRWWFWDDVAFIGVTGVVLAMVGGLGGRHRFRIQCLALVAALGTLAMGSSTPIYQWFFDWIPGFDLIRAPSKFMFFVSFFLAFLAGLGWDLLQEARSLKQDREGDPTSSPERAWLARSSLLSLGLGGLLVVGAVWIGSGTAQGDLSLLRWLAPIPADQVARAGTARQWVTMAASALWVAGGTALLLSVLLAGARRFQVLLLGVAVLGCVELFGFAVTHRGGVRADAGMRQRLGQQRVFDRLEGLRLMEAGVASNAPLGLGIDGVWGYDPVVLERYATLVAHSQGRAVEDLDNVRGAPPDQGSRLLRMLRLGAIVQADPAQRTVRVEWPGGALSRFEFVSEYQVENGPRAILEALDAAPFDPRRRVILEQAPSVEPTGTLTDASLSVLSESTDHVELSIDLDHPAILLWTDSYSEGWQVEALPDSVQTEYRPQPANLALRAVSLEAGLHHFRWVYRPRHLELGLMLSVLGCVSYVFAVGVWVFLSFRRTWAEPTSV
ncbi:MAG: hypothetical protein P8M78_14160 [Myxococcota bacterium]|nr:hypothetical protein [Myxococcota bacterium]